MITFITWRLQLPEMVNRTKHQKPATNITPHIKIIYLYYVNLTHHWHVSRATYYKDFFFCLKSQTSNPLEHKKHSYVHILWLYGKVTPSLCIINKHVQVCYAIPPAGAYLCEFRSFWPLSGNQLTAFINTVKIYTITFHFFLIQNIYKLTLKLILTKTLKFTTNNFQLKL